MGFQPTSLPGAHITSIKNDSLIKIEIFLIGLFRNVCDKSQ